jgi:hypothetical protein
MCESEVPKLLQQPLPPIGFELLQQLPGGKALEVAEHRGQIGRREDGMEVIVEDHPGMDPQILVLTAVDQRLDEDVAARRAGEDRQPFNNGASDEVGTICLRDSIAAAHNVRESAEAGASKARVHYQAGAW